MDGSKRDAAARIRGVMTKKSHEASAKKPKVLEDISKTRQRMEMSRKRLCECENTMRMLSQGLDDSFCLNLLQ